MCRGFTIPAEVLSLLRQRALRATFIARQLVDLSREEEASYCEHELGNLLLEESRDLPPVYDQLQRKPIKGADITWQLTEAANVLFNVSWMYC